MNIECMLIGGPHNGKRVQVPSHAKTIAVEGELYELGNSGPGYRYHVGNPLDTALAETLRNGRAFIRIDFASSSGWITGPQK